MRSHDPTRTKTSDDVDAWVLRVVSVLADVFVASRDGLAARAVGEAGTSPQTTVDGPPTNPQTAGVELPERWVTKGELAAVLGMSDRWVDKQVKLGMPTKRFGNRPRFQISEVEAWLSDNATTRADHAQPERVTRSS